jgi:cellulose synthase/poly-beta-1,6-N-acetylglucosamine synthase-like glycosyltransferase
MPADARLGDVLVANGSVSPEELDAALAVQARTGSPLGSVLLSRDSVTPRALYTALAATWGAAYRETEADDLDEEIIARVDLNQLLREEWLPLGRDGDGVVTVLTSRRPTDELRTAIGSALGEPVRLLVGSDWEVSRAIQRTHKAEVSDRAAHQLWRSDPEMSARTVLDRRQKIVGAIGLLAVAAAFVVEPRWSLIVTSIVVSLSFLISIAFKFAVCMTGARREFDVIVSDEEVAALRDDELPIYTVLVPCYKEAAIVDQLVTNLGGLDYPADKIQILLLLEADDAETLEAAKASKPPRTVTIVVTPDGHPKTKPKACNVGLMLARGEFLVIYDAEDRPDPDQLKKAVIGFRKAGSQAVCMQAALNYFNANENLLTRMFTLEYSFWFDYMLPGLDERHLPIPLGGTSNHFRTDALRELGGWDPFNVTEDADLGIRASVTGQRVGVINSTTLEEANRAYGNWIRQRSRWIKGYMQTALVHSRHPLRLIRSTGLRQASGFGMLIGGTPISFLATIPLYLLFLVSLFLPRATLSAYFPGWVLWFSLLNLLLGNGLMIWVSMMGAFLRRRYWLVPWALLNPLYWIMHSISAYKALFQLITRPHYWEKTTHGLTSVGHGPDAVPNAV